MAFGFRRSYLTLDWATTPTSVKVLLTGVGVPSALALIFAKLSPLGENIAFWLFASVVLIGAVFALRQNWTRQ